LYHHAAVALPDADDVFADPPIEDEMAEERHVTTPPAFAGKPEEDGDAWIRHLLNYCRYRSIMMPSPWP